MMREYIRIPGIWADGKKKFTYNRELQKKDERFIKATYLAMDDDGRTLQRLFRSIYRFLFLFTPSREDKELYNSRLIFSVRKNVSQWTYIPTEAVKIHGRLFGYYNGVVYLEVLRYGGAFDQKPDSLFLEVES